ncbi:MAG: hypothetical protein J5871_04110 [Bacteroidales bacterium]|nr:hypothetical protein [Bacteroidales bacterium]
MATISIILKKSKTNANGEHPVVLRLADANNKRAYFATGFSSTDLSVLLSIALYFILRFIHIPGKTLWLFLVLSLVTIVWAAISVIIDNRK